MGGKIKAIWQNLKSLAKSVKTWQLILILIPLLFIAATLLRFDHLKMNSLKEAVLAADEAGDTEELETSMQKLKDFTFHHIAINVVEKNGVQRVTFGTGPFYLEDSYTRDATAALAKAEEELGSDANPNGNVFAAAMSVCKPQAIKNGWSWNSEGYLSCMTGEINKYPSADNLSVTASLPSTSLYRYDFSSPVWTFCLSGVVILVCAILILVIFIRFLIWCVLRIALIFLK